MKTALSLPTLLTATILVILFAACVVAAARGDDGPPKNTAPAAKPTKSEKDVAAELAKAKDKLAPTYLLAYKFAAGDEVRTKVVHLNTIETKIKGSTQTAKTRTVATKLWRIQEINEQGQFVFEHVVEHVEMWNSVSGRAEIRYDSASGEMDRPGAIARAHWHERLLLADADVTDDVFHTAPLQLRNNGGRASPDVWLQHHDIELSEQREIRRAEIRAVIHAVS